MKRRVYSMQWHGFFLCIATVLIGCIGRSEAATTTFDETIDLSPSAPEAWQSADWDITTHSHNSSYMWDTIDPLAADFGSDCAPPPATHTITTYEESIFVCDGTVQTTLGSQGYHLTYLTPNHLVDFSDGEAVIRFDTSTLRFRGRDFLNIWVTPFDTNLQLPIQDWLPAAQGEPQDGLLVRTGMTNGYTRIEGSVVRDFAASTLYDNYTTIEAVLAEHGLAPSNTRLETFEIRLSADHLSVCFPEYNHCFLDSAINPPLDFTEGIVQFGHHAWSIEEPNTIHWDNFHIAPAVPFSMIKATNRAANAEADTFTFPQPALTNSYLRFVGIGGNLEVSFDGGSSWESAELQTHDPARLKEEQFRSFWMPVPPNTQTVKVRGENWYGGTWFAHSAAFWSLDGEVAPPATATPTEPPATETPTPPATATPQAPLEIEVSNRSGVSGYEIGVFGEGFGATTGLLTILGEPATIVEWEENFIRAVVPNVSDGTGDLRLERSNGDATTTPFTVYTIDPTFLQPPSKTFEEVSFDKTLFLDGVELEYCFDIDTVTPIEAGRFLTNYRCGSSGFVGSGEAVFAADSSIITPTTATIAYQSDTVLDGEYVFQFMTDFFWEQYDTGQTWRKSHPYNYTLEVSADSTDGTDGTWTTLETVTGSDRPMRFHTLDIPAAGNYTWLRMHVTDGSHDNSSADGRDFQLRQVRIYHATGTGAPDSFAIYGDAATYISFEIFGPYGFRTGVQNRRLADGALPLSVYGLPGVRADRLADGTTYSSDLFDALAFDNMGDNALYWAIALGTDDIIDAATLQSDPADFATTFGSKIDTAVQQLIAQGRVPIIGRVPDSIDGTLDTTAYKQAAIAAIDEVAATHRLIPGADLYTLFRRNIEADGASYFNGNTQPSYAGREAVIGAWIDAFVVPFPQAPQPTPTPTPVATETPTPTSTPDVVTPTPTATPPVTDPSITIEVANTVGIVGAEIGIFGEGFGTTAGTVSVLGTAAQVLEWSDSFIRLVVPPVADGDGYLHLVTADNRNGYAPFTVYTVDPVFLQAPDKTFENIAAGRTVFLQNLESHFCFQQPDGNSAHPSEFLTDYRCGSNGVTRTGSAQFSADSSLNEVAIIAIDLEDELSGDYFFSYFVNGSWYPRPNSGGFPESNPRNYELQVSADSTDGINGTWVTLSTINDNDRSQRTHAVAVPAAGYHWFRMRVTDGNANVTQNNGTDFALREIRLFAVEESGNRPDSFVIYGDSLTASGFETIGSMGLAANVKGLRDVDQDMMVTTFGLSGQNSTGLTDQADITYDIYDALTLDEMQTNALFWGIALGTNDALDPDNAIGVNGFNVTEYGGRLDAAVADLIAQGRVPIVARIPDTDEALGGYGTLATKRKILGDIDAVVAKYRLIPGPDLYTTFRYNIENDDSSYFAFDGTHHSDAGMLKLIDLWAEAFTSAVPTEPTPEPTPSPTPTNTPTATPVPQSRISVADDYIVATGEQVTVTILLDPDGNSIGATTVDLTFDDQLLDVVSCSADPANQFDSAFCNANYASNGLRVTMLSNNGVATAGSVADIVFNATGNAGNASDLLLAVSSSVDPSGNPIALTIDDGRVVITGSIVGDVSCDVQRNIIDALFISQYVAALRTATTNCPLTDNSLNITQCDVDENETCDIVDAMFIAQCEVGMSNALCVQQRRALQHGATSATLAVISPTDGEVAIAVTMGGRAATGALTLDLAYDPTVATPVGCSVGSDMVGACNIAFADGVVRLTAATFTSQVGEVHFGKVYFEAVGGALSAEMTAQPVQLSTSNGERIELRDVKQVVRFTPTVPTVIVLDSAETSAISPIWLTLSAAIMLTTWVLVRRLRS